MVPDLFWMWERKKFTVVWIIKRCFQVVSTANILKKYFPESGLWDNLFTKFQCKHAYMSSTFFPGVWKPLCTTIVLLQKQKEDKVVIKKERKEKLPGCLIVLTDWNAKKIKNKNLHSWCQWMDRTFLTF